MLWLMEKVLLQFRVETRHHSESRDSTLRIVVCLAHGFELLLLHDVLIVPSSCLVAAIFVVLDSSLDEGVTLSCEQTCIVPLRKLDFNLLSIVPLNHCLVASLDIL